MNPFELHLRLEQNDNLHEARLLVLLAAFCGTEPSEPIEGLTKIAKLDFLLRYPVFLEKALRARHVSSDAVKVSEHERHSIESAMIRFKYGPWDFRYRRFINMLTAKGLAYVRTAGNTIVVGPTEAGLDKGRMLSTTEAFRLVYERAVLLRRHVNLKATHLMQFIYKVFPEIGTLRYGETILP